MLDAFAKRQESHAAVFCSAMGYWLVPQITSNDVSDTALDILSFLGNHMQARTVGLMCLFAPQEHGRLVCAW
jgi:hypothetical protein